MKQWKHFWLFVAVGIQTVETFGAACIASDYDCHGGKDSCEMVPRCCKQLGLCDREGKQAMR